MELKRPWLIGAAVTAAIVYAALWVGYVQNWAWLDAIDTVSLQVFHDFGAAHPGWVQFWVVFCILFGPNGFRLMALGLIVVALIRRNVQTALFLIISVELMGLVTEVAKRIAGRPRPATALTDAASSSFPSGHALGVTVGVLALLTAASPMTGQRLRVLHSVLGGLLIFTVGLSRVLLNVHHPSDVVAGWALGLLYYLLCVRLMPPRRLTSEAETPAEFDSVP